jgi:glutathionylspermidine synthase
MERHLLQPRPDWRERVAAVGLTYHSHEDGPYWDESACYELTAAEVESLERAANRLHTMCIEAAGAVIEHGWWERLSIPPSAIPAILASWERDDFSVYGRFDLAFDPGGEPKLLEYNADTPTALVEAAVAQWFWLQDVAPDADQFNSIHERLIEAWRRWAGRPIHFSSIQDHPEDEQTVLYLRDTCEQAGVPTRGVSVEEIGWDERRTGFVDLDLAPIERCFKLYPWEWMWAEEFGPNLAGTRAPADTNAKAGGMAAAAVTTGGTQFIEPPWKMLLSNKGLLPILWELYPGHPNLLPAYEGPARLRGSYVRKPRLSREGSNVTWVEGGTVVEETSGEYGSEGHIYQAVATLPEFTGNRPIFGAWIVDHEAAGLGIREDTRRITGNLSRFVPHYFR